MQRISRIADETTTATAAQSEAKIRLEALRSELSRAYFRHDHPDGRDRTRLVSVSGSGVEKVRELELAYHGLLRQVELEEAAASGQPKVTAPLPEIGDIQAVLGTQEALIEYYTIGDSISAFCINHSGVQVHRNICSRESVVSLARRLRFQTQRAEAFAGGVQSQFLADTNNVLKELYSALLTPID